MSAGDGRRIIEVQWIPVADRLPEEPKNVLAFAPDAGGGGRRLRAFYARSFEIELGADDSIAEPDIDEQGGEFLPVGWYETSVYGEFYYPIGEAVTHWMELPAGPETQAGR